jgi:hypothetical protein
MALLLQSLSRTSRRRQLLAVMSALETVLHCGQIRPVGCKGGRKSGGGAQNPVGRPADRASLHG